MLTVEAGEDVDDSEVADVADVEAGAGRIGKHFGEVHFGGAGFLGRLVGFIGLPLLKDCIYSWV